ncbi:WD40 repeat-like protein, partial [Rickenella mellea]
KSWHEHTRRFFTVDWSNINKEFFASASWDGLAKIVRLSLLPFLPSNALPLPPQSNHPNPDSTQQRLDSSADGCFKIFDLRVVSSSFSSATTPNGRRASEVLGMDWGKYRPFVLASAGVDRVIRVWDCRMVKKSSVATGGGQMLYPPTPTAQVSGHEYAVRRVQWSSHLADVLASASYDMTCRVYVLFPSLSFFLPQIPLLAIHDMHTEFVFGCAWLLYEEGLLASCVWDGRFVFIVRRR